VAEKERTLFGAGTADIARGIITATLTTIAAIAARIGVAMSSLL
jgi:hypothetical protein